MKTEETPTRFEDKIRRVLFNEVSFGIATVSLIASVIFWVQSPQQELNEKIIRLETQLESNETIAVELAKIKNNDLHEMQLRLDRIEERQVEMLQAVARLEALLNRK